MLLFNNKCCKKESQIIKFLKRLQKFVKFRMFLIKINVRKGISPNPDVTAIHLAGCSRKLICTVVNNTASLWFHGQLQYLVSSKKYVSLQSRLIPDIYLLFGMSLPNYLTRTYIFQQHASKLRFTLVG